MCNKSARPRTAWSNFSRYIPNTWQYIYSYTRANKLQWNGKTPKCNARRTVLLQSSLIWNNRNQCDHIIILLEIPRYAEETAPLITKFATYIKTYKKQEAKQQYILDETSLNHITQILTSKLTIKFSLLIHNQPPVPTPWNQQTPYSRILTQNLQSSNISEQHSTVLNEFKGTFNLLISKNSMVLNMLSTLKSNIAQ